MAEIIEKNLNLIIEINVKSLIKLSWSYESNNFININAMKTRYYLMKQSWTVDINLILKIILCMQG